MIIFINDSPIRVLNQRKFKLDYQATDFDVILDAKLDIIKINAFFGHVVIFNADKPTADKIIKTIKETPQLIKYQSIMMVTENEEPVEEAIKQHYVVVKAAGGVVFKDKKILLMRRNLKWDLPKGKLDSGEKSQIAAVREIEEETGVKAKIIMKICTTWHAYTQNEKNYIKRTKWYLLESTDDSKLKPQAEEGITELKWADNAEVRQAMTDTYTSIRFVVDSYNRMIRNSLVYGN
jgi:8-oxo-dGTP pyrophosphatase MutT (NUDIX family)